MKNEIKLRRLVVLKVALAPTVSIVVFNSPSVLTSLYQAALFQNQWLSLTC